MDKNLKERMLFDYYIALLNKNSAKHNHKETTAWGGLVSYVLFCSAVAGSGVTTSALRYSVALTICTLLVSIPVFVYLKNQLYLKDRASARIASATDILSQIISDPAMGIDKYASIQIHDEQGSSSLPSLFIEKQKQWTKQHLGEDQEIKITRFVMQWLFFVAGISTLLSLWIKYLPHICVCSK